MMFRVVARLMYRQRVAVLIAYAVLFPLALVFGVPVVSQLKAGGFEDPSRESWQVFALMQREMGAGVGDIIALYETPTGTVEDPEVMGAILTVTTALEKDADVSEVTSLYTTGAPHFISKDRSKTFIAVDLRGSEQHKTEVFKRLTPVFAAEGLKVRFAGIIPTNISVFETIRSDLTRAELLAFPLTALLCIVIFESLASVAVLLLTALCGMVFAFAALRGIALFSDVSVFAVNTITILGLGLAVDYSLFLVNRFREELPQRGTEEAVVTTLATTGRAVAFSGVIVAASLMGLFAFEHMVLRSLALGGVVVVFATVIMALTLVPAVLAVLGPRVDAWPIRRRRTPSPSAPLPDDDNNVFGRIARAVMKRPLLVAIVVSAALLSLAAPMARFNGSLVDVRVLPQTDSGGVRATSDLLDSEFLPHQGTPHMVLVTTTGDVRSRENLAQVSALSSRIAALPGVARVDGVFTFVAGASREQIIDAIAADKGPLDVRAYPMLPAYMKGSWMRFAVLSERGFDDAVTLEQVRALRAMSTPGLKVEVAGYAAALTDLRAAIRDRGPWMVLAVAAVMFLVLFLAFGSVTLPLKAMLMNSLSLTASFGAIVWIFQDGRFTRLLGYTSLGVSDSTQPLVMFAIVFGLSMDYEVLILARVREEYLRSGDNSAAVARGLARTGRLITSAAALLVVVVGAFSTSEVLFMKTLGVGMALAIALDATIVRALLVPAMMELMGKWNWYAPAPLVRLWKRTGMSDAGE